jgi:chemotaxis regulatin CheY-phosphate phosphatase CheZ
MYSDSIKNVERKTRELLDSYQVSEQDIERVIQAGKDARDRHQKLVADLDAGLIQEIDFIHAVHSCMGQLNDDWKNILDEESYRKLMNIPVE